MSIYQEADSSGHCTIEVMRAATMSYSKEVRDGAVALVLSGLSAEAAARRAGASASSVRGRCLARGVGLRLGRRGGAAPRQMEGPPAAPPSASTARR